MPLQEMDSLAYIAWGKRKKKIVALYNIARAYTNLNLQQISR